MPLLKVVDGVPEHPERARFVHPRIFSWAQFDPPLRDPGARGCPERSVYCRTCGQVLGTTDDPLDAFLIAWRHHREVRRRSKQRMAPSSVGLPDARAS